MNLPVVTGNIMRIIQFILLITLTMIWPDLKSQSFTIYRGDTINRINENGLKYGHWIYFKDFERNSVQDHVDTINPRITRACDYIIINTTNENIISFKEDEDNFYIEDTLFWSKKLGTGELLLKDSTSISYYSKYENSYSVLDGLLFNYNPNIEDTCELWSISSYSKGKFVQRQEYKKGIPTVFTKENNHTEDKYIGSDPYVYERTIYLKNGLYKTVYYPDKKLNISDNYISLYSPIGTTDTSSLILSSNTEDTLFINIKTNRNDIVFNSNKKTIKDKKLIIYPRESIQVDFIYTPTGISFYTCEDEIIFNNNTEQLGKVNLHCIAFHLSMKKQTKKEFLVKKNEISDDGFIIDLCSFNKYSSAEFKDNNGNLLKSLRIPMDLPCLGKIPVKEYPTGTYYLTFNDSQVGSLTYK